MRQRIGHVFRFVAFFTVYRFVFALQRITGSIVVKSIQVSHFSERVFLVAIHTFVAEFVIVHILVAGNTIVCLHADPVLKNVLWRCGHGMAFPAIHLFVFPFQREFGGIVVKLVHAGPACKGLVVMAIFAVVSELVIVRVFVATVAVFERHIRKTLKLLAAPRFFFVAFEALHGFVFSCQRKIRPVVVKLARRNKLFIGMAFGAIIPQGFLVHVFVAIHTFVAQSQKGVLPFFQVDIFNQIRQMAFPAIDLFVRPLQFKTSLCVVEIFLIKPHHVEIAAVVIAMAFGTIF